MESAYLSAKALSAGYGRKIIIDSLEFEVYPGEILTLIGPNGAGKSTVLKTLSAQLSPLSGTVYIGGKDIAGLKENEIARNISLLLTERKITDRMTCEDVVSAGRYPYTGRLGILSENDRRITEYAMKRLNVLHLRDRDFRCVSDGQKQCVMIARALAQQPAVMLLDEPTSFLDIGNKLKIQSLLREIARETNTAVIQTLHETDLAQKYSDRIICINSGKAEKIGTPDEIFSGGYIEKLFGIENGVYNSVYGTAEIKGPRDSPRVFVIGGGGSGTEIYRKLYRSGTPFAAGVIHENDIEFPIVSALASRVAAEKPFEPISHESLEAARRIIDECSEVICCPVSFGSMNAGNRELAEYAGDKVRFIQKNSTL